MCKENTLLYTVPHLYQCTCACTSTDTDMITWRGLCLRFSHTLETLLRLFSIPSVTFLHTNPRIQIYTQYILTLNSPEAIALLFYIHTRHHRFHVSIYVSACRCLTVPVIWIKRLQLNAHIRYGRVQSLVEIL